MRDICRPLSSAGARKGDTHLRHRIPPPPSPKPSARACLRGERAALLGIQRARAGDLDGGAFCLQTGTLRGEGDGAIAAAPDELAAAGERVVEIPAWDQRLAGAGGWELGAGGGGGGGEGGAREREQEEDGEEVESAHGAFAKVGQRRETRCTKGTRVPRGDRGCSDCEDSARESCQKCFPK